MLHPDLTSTYLDGLQSLLGMTLKEQEKGIQFKTPPGVTGTTFFVCCQGGKDRREAVGVERLRAASDSPVPLGRGPAGSTSFPAPAFTRPNSHTC